MLALLGFSANAVLVCLAASCVFGFIYLYFFYPDFRHIDGIPEPPGTSLLHGHLYLLGNDHATKLQQWSQQYGWPVFQIRLGYRRVIVLNSFDAAREWLVTNQASTIDRPRFYTFHGVVSKTSASTIGTNPWNEATKKQRRVVNSLTAPPAMRRLTGMFDLETADMVRSIYERGQGGAVEVSPHIFQKRLALNIVLMFCYGRRFEDIEDPMLLQILSDVSVISSFRSTNANAQDHVPYLRYFGFLNKARTKIAAEVRARRDRWLAALLQEVKDKRDAGEKQNCVAAGLLSNDEEKLAQLDVRTILGGLMSGGFETIISSAIAGIAYLASPEGQEIQQKAHDDILASYDSIEEAFRLCVSEERSKYVVALVRETLRYYPPSHLLPPRQTYREFVYNGHKVPKGVMVLVNTQAANHDPATYGQDAHLFRPERWLDPSDKDKNSSSGFSKAVPPPYHFAYGAGSRGCTAINFSNRVLYAIFLRLIVSFRIRQSESAPPCTHYVDYNPNLAAQTAIPRDFRAAFAVRDVERLRVCLGWSEGDTREVGSGLVG